MTTIKVISASARNIKKRSDFIKGARITDDNIFMAQRFRREQ